MNDHKLKQLFDAARRAPAPEPAADFAADVLRAARRTGTAPGTQSLSVSDQLNVLFPRVAWAALAVILLCGAIEWTANSSAGTDDAGISGMTPSLFDSEDL
jgi:hypothetical protein